MPEHPIICSRCGERVYPQMISVTVLDQEARVDVDERGVCAVCRWVGERDDTSVGDAA